jgi:hypothetical protein
MTAIECGYPSDHASLKEQGATLTVYIGYPPNLLMKLTALIDTGGTANTIEATIATRLRLPVVEFDNVRGVHGGKDTTVHASLMSIPVLNINNEPHRFHAGDIHPRQVLLGRLFLEKYKLTYDGRTGSVFISNDP